MKRKEIICAVLDSFPDKDFNIEISNTDNLIRVDLKGYILEHDQINALLQVHPFRIMLNSPGSLSKTTFILFFDL